MNLVAKSMSRYNGGVAAKRQYGSSTITKFVVYRVEDAKTPSLWVEVEVGGKTPGERLTAAKAKAEPLIQKLLSSKGITVANFIHRRASTLTADDIIQKIKDGIGSTFDGLTMIINHGPILGNEDSVYINYRSVSPDSGRLAMENAKHICQISIEAGRAWKPKEAAPDKVKVEQFRNSGCPKIRAMVGTPEKVVAYVVKYFLNNAKALKEEKDDSTRLGEAIRYRGAVYKVASGMTAADIAEKIKEGIGSEYDNFHFIVRPGKLSLVGESSVDVIYRSVPPGTKGVALDNADHVCMISIYGAANGGHDWKRGEPTNDKVKVQMHMSYKCPQMRMATMTPEKAVAYIVKYFLNNKEALQKDADNVQ